MTESIDVKKIRKRVAVAYMKDGLFELYIGFSLTIIGLFELQQHYAGGEGFNAAYSPILVIFPMFAFFILKRKMTRPRIGYANLKSDRYGTNKLHLVFVVIGAVILFTLIYLLQVSQTVEGTVGAHKPYVGLYFSVFVAMVLSLLAVAGEAPLMHIGSVSFMLVFGGLFLFNLYIGLGFVICGGGLLVVGTVMLTRFLRDNPLPPAEDYEGPVTNG